VSGKTKASHFLSDQHKSPQLISSLLGDRVQWFRAEAEMQRWQEQVEQKLAELLRTIRSFGKMKDIWSQLSSMQPNTLPGHIAYANRQSAMYARLESDSKKKLGEAGYKRLLSMDGPIVDFVKVKRAEEEAFLAKALRERSSEFFGLICWYRTSFMDWQMQLHKHLNVMSLFYACRLNGLNYPFMSINYSIY